MIIVDVIVKDFDFLEIGTCSNFYTLSMF